MLINPWRVTPKGIEMTKLELIELLESVVLDIKNAEDFAFKTIRREMIDMIDGSVLIHTGIQYSRKMKPWDNAT